MKGNFHATPKPTQTQELCLGLETRATTDLQIVRNRIVRNNCENIIATEINLKAKPAHFENALDNVFQRGNSSFPKQWRQCAFSKVKLLSKKRKHGCKQRADSGVQRAQSSFWFIWLDPKTKVLP